MNPSSSCPVCSGAGEPGFRGQDFLRGRPEDHYDYLQCRQCHAEYQHPMPDATTIAGYYSEDYAVHQEVRPKATGWLEQCALAARHGYRHLPLSSWEKGVGWLVSPWVAGGALDFIQGGQLLDVGCGNGQFLYRHKALGWQVAGVDFSPKAVAACHALGLDQVRLGDLVGSGFPDASFDLVTMRHVIEHLPEPHAWLNEIHRLLKPGGLFLLQTPNARALGRSWLGIHWYANDVPRHLVLYSPENLKKLLSDHGFRLVSQSTDSTPKVLLNSLDCRANRQGVPSRKIGWRRFLARLYVLASRFHGRGDDLRLLGRKE